MKIFKPSLLAVVCAALFILAPRAVGQNLAAEGKPLATEQTNGVYRLVATVGQPLIGVSQNAAHVSSAGLGYLFAHQLASEEEQNAGAALPTEYRLEQNFPNPFNPTTAIGFALPEPSFVTLKLYDVLGREVATLVHKELPAGEHRFMLSAHNLPSGVYLYRMETKSFVQQKKLAVMK